MSLKFTELQVAIPRTGSVGHLQNELLQKPIQDQAMLAAAAMKETEKKRKKSNEIDKTTEHLKANQEGRNGNQRNDKGSKNQDKEIDSSDHIGHPYKGHHIDLSL